MSHGYFASPLSENISETPEGFLICHDSVLGRTGWQTYKVGELPKEAADRLGIDVSDPRASIDLYRSADSVFHPDTLASIEGKPVTDEHPDSEDGFVHPDNFARYARGHVQNVRRGREPLDDGEWPIVGDLVITADPLLSKVRNRQVRELSLGYDYGIERAGDRVEQVDIVANHCAVVPRGRAGPEARIQDSAPPEDAVPTKSPPAPAPQGEKASTSTPTKEKRPVKNNFLHLIGLGLKAKAADADPEELAQAAMEIGKHQEPPAQSEDKHADDRHTDDKRADDHRADDRRRRLHDALDRCMDRKADDSDIEALKNNLGEFLSEEEDEPEHAGDMSELEDAMGARDGEMCPECGKADDECECESAEDAEEDEGGEIGEVTEESGREVVADRARAADTVSGARAVLKALRPVVARTKDARVRSAFNSALAAVSRGSRPASGGYDSFARTARARDKARTAPAHARGRAADAANDPIKKLQAAYDAARNGGK